MTNRTEPVEDAGFLAPPIVAIARTCRRHPWLVLAVVFLSCAVSLAYTALRLQYHTHRNDLIGKEKDYYQRWKKYVHEFGDDDDLVVVVEGSRRESMVAALEGVARRVATDTQHFDRLNYKVDLRSLRNRSLLYLPTDQLRTIQESVKPMAMLLEPPVLGLIDPLAGWKRLTLYEMLEKSALLNGPLNPEQNFQPDQDPLLRQLATLCRKALTYLESGHRYESPWTEFVAGEAPRNDLLAAPWYFFSPDDSLAFLMVRPVKDTANGFTFAQKSIVALQTILQDLRTEHPDVGLGLTGIPVLENDEMISTQDDSMRASWLALLGVAILYFLVYRGLRYPLMTVAALLVGSSWALGWLTLTVGHLNILSSAFAVMLIGMGDYGVLWVTRFGQERAGGVDGDEANRMTAASVGPSILTAALATALSFFATMLADLQAVAELGWTAGSGVLLCALSCFVVMPALLALFDSRHHHPAILPLNEQIENRRRWLPVIMNRPRMVLAASAAMTVVLGYFAWHVPYDHNLLKLQSPELESVRWQHKIIDRAPEGNLYAISYTNTPEEALALKERYERLPGVSRVVEVATLIPRDQSQKLETLHDLQQRLRKLPPRGTQVRHDVPDAAGLTRATNVLLDIFEPCQQLRPCVFLADLNADLRRLRNLFAGDRSAQVCRRLREFEDRMGQDLMENMHRLREVATPAPITLADLPTCLRERYVGYSGKWLLAIYPRTCLWEYDNLQAFVAQVQTVDAEATGRPFTILEGLRAMRHGFLWAGVYALVAMLFVLLLDFGTIKHTVVALVPLAMGMIAALGCLGLLGFSLNPANLIAFPLILGVGADNGVHVLHDFRSRSRSHRYQLSFATGRGIMVAALTTILGFGTLMIAQHRGLASLGLALTLGVATCMFTALVFLPALLSLLGPRQATVVESLDRVEKAA